MAEAQAPGEGLLARLGAAVGAEHVLVDADVRAGYELDWTGRWRGLSSAVVRPQSTAEVAAVLQACAAAGASVVTQGGNTGLVGGGVPGPGQDRPQILLSTRRLSHVGPVDRAAAQVTAGAGATIADVQRRARASGLDLAVDWGARDTATVGGAVATNAGGSRVVRFGTMRRQVVGIEAVLADGTVLSDLHGLAKSTAGLHLPSLLSGSEGTLAVITAARLQLVAHFAHHATAWIALASVNDAVAVLPVLRGIAALDAVEILLPDALEAACTEFGLHAPPTPAGAVVVVVDCADHRDPTDELAHALADAGLEHAAIATGAQRQRIMDVRDHVSMAIARRGTPLKLDVAVPVHRLAELVDHAAAAVRAASAGTATLYTFGHLAEGNLHLNVIGPPADDHADELTEAILGWVIAAGGTISAEHGIGRAKAGWLERARGGPATELMRAIKHGLDPEGTLNPGVLLAH